MRRFATLCLLASLCALPAATQPTRPSAAPTARAPLTPAAIARLAVPATVTILVFDASGDTLGQGSGVIVRPTGEIVTNWHVMQGAARATVRLSTGERFERVQAVDGDSTVDLAIIKVPGFDLPTVPLSGVVPSVGSHVVVIGSPLGLNQTVSDGLVSAVRLYDGRQHLQISAPISHGSSGGPVFSDAGEVIGIARSTLDGGQQLNFAIPMKYALGLLAEKRAPSDLVAMFGGSGGTVATSSSAATGGGRVPTSVVYGSGVVDEFVKRPNPARAARPSLPFTGTYYLTDSSVLVVKKGTTEPRLIVHEGSMHLMEDGTGLVRTRRHMYPEDTLTDEMYTRFLADLNATPDGRLSLRGIGIGGEAAAGFQVDGGAFFESDYETDSLILASRIWVERYAPKLTGNEGLYSVTVDSRWVSGSYRAPDRTAWTGELLLRTLDAAGDSAYLNVSLRNARGGTTGFESARVRSDAQGYYTARSGDGTITLHFFVRAGRIYGDWLDKRDKGARYEGTLEGGRK